MEFSLDNASKQCIQLFISRVRCVRYLIDSEYLYANSVGGARFLSSENGAFVTRQTPNPHVIVFSTLYNSGVILCITRSTVLIESRKYGNAAIHICLLSRYCASLWGILGSCFTCIGAQ
jgi:hypothetical protein